MSASREKKQRRDTDAPSLSPRAQEEQAKTARRKRNTIVYTAIGVVLVILVAALLIWDSGIIQRRSTVATIDGEKVTAPQVLFYYQNNFIIQYAQYYAQFGSVYPYYSLYSSPKDQIITDDTVADLGLDESYAGKTFHEYFLDYAMDSLRQEYTLCAAAEAAGYTLSDEGKATVEQAMAQLDAQRQDYTRTTLLKQLYGKVMTESAYRSCLERQQLAVEYYNTALDSLTGYSDAELDSWYQDHRDDLDTVTYYWQEFESTTEGTVDSSGNVTEPTEEDEAAALAAAWEAANSAMAEVVEDPDSVKDNADFTEASGVPTPGSFYYDWLIDPEREPGDAKIFEGSYGSYYLAVFGSRERDETPTVDARHILVSAMPEDDPATTDVDESSGGATDETYAAAKTEAERILAEWQAGEATEASFAALADQYSADPGSNTKGGLYTKIEKGQMIANFNDWIFDSHRKSGDTGIVQNDASNSSINGWHIIYYVGQNEPAWKTSAREAKWAEDLKDSVQIVRTDKLDRIVD